MHDVYQTREDIMEHNISRRDRKKEILIRQIVHTAIQLFLSQGFDSTTMEQIAKEADVAKRTLYNYFPNKDSIIVEYMKTTVEDNRQKFNEILSNSLDTPSRLHTLLMEINKWHEANKSILKMHTSYRIKDFIFTNEKEIEENSFEGALLKIMLKGQDQGDLCEDISAENLVKYFKALYTTYFIQWIFSEDQHLEERGLEEIIRFFFNGARREK
jgi:AcrR family transcriptional regulator